MRSQPSRSCGPRGQLPQRASHRRNGWRRSRCSPPSDAYLPRGGGKCRGDDKRVAVACVERPERNAHVARRGVLGRARARREHSERVGDDGGGVGDRERDEVVRDKREERGAARRDARGRGVQLELDAREAQLAARVELLAPARWVEERLRAEHHHERLVLLLHRRVAEHHHERRHVVFARRRVWWRRRVEREVRRPECAEFCDVAAVVLEHAAHLGVRDGLDRQREHRAFRVNRFVRGRSACGNACYERQAGARPAQFWAQRQLGAVHSRALQYLSVSFWPFHIFHRRTCRCRSSSSHAQRHASQCVASMQRHPRATARLS